MAVSTTTALDDFPPPSNLSGESSESESSDDEDAPPENNSSGSDVGLFLPNPSKPAYRPPLRSPLRPGGVSISLADIIPLYQEDNYHPPEDDYWPDMYLELSFDCENLGLKLLVKPAGGVRKKPSELSFRSGILELKERHGDYNELINFTLCVDDDKLQFLQLTPMMVLFPLFIVSFILVTFFVPSDRISSPF